jgi:hypothetical protein
MTAIEQVLYGNPDAGGYQLLARSPGFADGWLPDARRLCAGFGDRPAGVACPACVFAQPLGPEHVAIVQAADQGSDDTGRPGALAFHLLILPHAAYAQLGGDPFAVAERFPPPWAARGELPTLSGLEGPLPARTVTEVQAALQRADGPSLLGGAQALLQGDRLVFERPAPDTDLLRSLWLLLPTDVRGRLWPASFAFGNALGFHALVTPRAAGPEFAGYLSEDQAAEYPEGRYELSLQTAAEAGDQRELDALFNHRLRAAPWRLGIILLCLALVLLLLGRWLDSMLAPARKETAPPAEGLNLPPAQDYPKLNPSQQQRLTRALQDFAEQLHVPPPAEPTSEALLTAITDRLGPGAEGRDPGDALTTGPVVRRLRALAWKHGLAEYGDPQLNPLEIVERLRHHVLGPGPGGKESRER